MIKLNRKKLQRREKRRYSEETMKSKTYGKRVNHSTQYETTHCEHRKYRMAPTGSAKAKNPEGD